MKPAVVLSIVLLSTCLPETEPRAANVHFGYTAGDRVTQPGQVDMAVTVESHAEIEIFVPLRLEGGSAWLERDQLESVEIQSVSSENEEILRVVSHRGSQVTVEGASRGTTRLLFRTARGLAELTVGVAEPTRVELRYEPRDGEVSSPGFLVGGTARFSMVQRDAAGRLLSGHGAPVPVHVDPPGAAVVSIREGDTEHADVRFDRGGEITLRPLGGAAVSGEAVEATDEHVSIDLVMLDEAGGATPLEMVPPGERRLLLLSVTHDDGRRLFGLIGRTSLSSTTTDVCDVVNAEQWHTDGVYELRSDAAGGCVLEAYFDELSTTFELPLATAAGSPNGPSDEGVVEPDDGSSAP